MSGDPVTDPVDGLRHTVARARALLDDLARATAGTSAADVVVVRAPGRVNILGEHTDYNDGLCLPAAIDRQVVVAAAAGPDVLWRLVSDGHDPTDAVEPAAVIDDGSDAADWVRLASAVECEIRDLGFAPAGLVAAVASDLPEGAGLSSSAAFELGVAVARCATSGLRVGDSDGGDLDHGALAALARRAEHRGLGVACGPLDQIAVARGVADHALLLDCRDLSVETVALPDDLALLVLDSGVPRTLAEAGYNERVAECAAARRMLGVTSLRDVGVDDLASVQRSLDPELAARVRHVVTENERVRAAVGSDAATLGSLVAESHRSLAEDYAVSVPAVDELVALAGRTDGVLGSRVVGAGFGGSVLAVVAADAATSAAAALHAARPSVAEPVIVRCSDGVTVVT